MSKNYVSVCMCVLALFVCAAGIRANAARSCRWTYMRHRSKSWIAGRLQTADDMRLPLECRTAIQLYG
jgi:hypothetical protein